METMTIPVDETLVMQRDKIGKTLTEPKMSDELSQEGANETARDNIYAQENKNEYLKIRLSDNEMEAYIVMSPDDAERISKEHVDVKMLLEDEGIVYGIKKNIYHILMKRIAKEANILVASGLESTKGANGYVKILKQENKHAIDEIVANMENEGKVNLRESVDIGIIRRGDIVAELVKPRLGEDGTTVTGKIIPAEPGVPAKISAGRNVVVTPDGETAVATTDGRLVVSGQTVSIDELLVIERNIDYSTGNIKFDGAVCIKGDVMPGFYVSATGDVEVLGVVDEGTVISDGRICIGGAVYGSEKSKIKAKRDIQLKSADKANITTGGKLLVSNYLRNCVVESEDGVYVLNNKKGHILGGRR